MDFDKSALMLAGKYTQKVVDLAAEGEEMA
jgi:hypothetical protein